MRRPPVSALLLVLTMVGMAPTATLAASAVRSTAGVRSTPHPAPAEQRLAFGRFGRVTVYRNSPAPAHAILFVSGDGGWNGGVVDMAHALAALDAVVVGIDITHYLKQLAASPEACGYPAADFEALSQFVQHTLGFPAYAAPVLVGYSSGATLVYATLVQAPPNTFRGAISLGFCPDLPLARPLCRGHGLDSTAGPKGKGVSFLPAQNLTAPWIALQGTIDQVCDAGATQKYVGQTPGAEIVMLPSVGHGFSVPKNWMPQFRDAFGRVVERAGALVAPDAPTLQDLPLVEVAPKGTPTDTFAVILSGDGGWASIDREIGDALAGAGVAVVGLDSLRYFWVRRSPDDAARDLERVVRHYVDAWRKRRVLLIGYSRGADVLPFMANRLPPALRASIPLVALLGPSLRVDFEFHLSDWLGGDAGGNARPVLPEVEKLRGLRVLCVYGSEEADSLCTKLGTDLATPLAMAGGHHFGSDYSTIARRILAEAGIDTPHAQPAGG